MISIEFTGQVDLQKAFDDLSKATKGRIGNKALITALTPILSDAKSRTPVDTGNLRDSLGFKVVKFKDGNLTAIIGPRKGFTRKGRVAHKYAHLVEFGHLSRAATGESVASAKGTSGRKKTFEAKSFVLPQPFMRPAFESKKGEALAALGRVLGTEITAAAKRSARRKAKRS